MRYLPASGWGCCAQAMRITKELLEGKKTALDSEALEANDFYPSGPFKVWCTE